MGRLAVVTVAVVAAVALLQLPAMAQDAPEQGLSPEAPPPPAVIVLPLPQNPSTDCGQEVFHELTSRYRSCFYTMYNHLNPSEDCCSGYAAYYGMNSTLPSRNCFCDPDVWADFSAKADKVYYHFDEAFLYCGRFGYAIPFNANAGEGYCYGKAPTMEEIMEVNIEVPKRLHTSSVAEYFKKLHKDGLASVAFASSIISGIGLLFILWPSAFDAMMSCMG